MSKTQQNNPAHSGRLVAITGKLPALSSSNLNRLSAFLVHNNTVLSQSPLSDKGTFQFHVAKHLANAPGVSVVLGPKALDPQSVLSHADLPRAAVSGVDRQEGDAINVSFADQNIDDKLIDLWWIWCREYTVSGTLETAAGCPVGASVTVYNVTCGVGGLVETPIETVTTDANGNFTFTFNWCSRTCWWPCWPIWWYCWPWWWEWDILAVLENVERQIAVESSANLFVAPASAAPLRQPLGADLMTGVGFASTRAVSELKPDSARTALIASKFANPRIRELFPYWWWCCENPNIVFSATQGTTTILNENPSTSTRWCFASGQTVALTGNSQTAGSCQVQSNGECGFEWSSVGDMPGGTAVGDITSGYANGAPGSVCSNMAFNGSLDLWGNFGGDCFAFYQVQASQWNGNPARGGSNPGVYEPLSAALVDSVTIFRGGSWLAPVPVVLGPCSLNGVDNLYMTRLQRQTGVVPAGVTGLPPFPALLPGDLIFWSDGSTGTGLVLTVAAADLVGSSGAGGVTLALVPYDINAVPVFDPSPSFGPDLTLMIDTTPLSIATIDWNPPAQSGVFSGVYNADGTPATLTTGSTTSCLSYQISGSGYVLIHSTVVDPQGHLAEYYIETQYGDNETITPVPGDRDYAQPPSSFTTAGTPPTTPLAVDSGYSVPNTSSSPTPAVPGPSIPAWSFAGGGDTTFIPITTTCCYDFQLWVSKRTTNGYNSFCGDFGLAHFQTVNITIV
jgi:hypothetical protein